MWFVELKTETGRLSKLQRYQIDRMLRQNCDVLVLYGKRDVEKAMAIIFTSAEGGDTE